MKKEKLFMRVIRWLCDFHIMYDLVHQNKGKDGPFQRDRLFVYGA